MLEGPEEGIQWVLLKLFTSGRFIINHTAKTFMIDPLRQDNISRTTFGGALQRWFCIVLCCATALGSWLRYYINLLPTAYDLRP